MRARVCEGNGNGCYGWTTMQLLECQSGLCGHCHDCKGRIGSLLPSENLAKREWRAARLSKLRQEKLTKADAFHSFH